MTMTKLEHGGQLAKVAKQYNIPAHAWLDLSTGISPFSYPIPNIPIQFWQQLPIAQDGLIAAAKQYYQANFCLPCSGSQQIIELLPSLWLNQMCSLSHDISASDLTVYLPSVGYKEHQGAWQLAGFQLKFYDQNLPNELMPNSVVVVINPNNPSGQLHKANDLTQLQANINQQQGLLIVDEAFMDVIQPSESIVSQLTENTLVLRSFGKFFGLAGIRIGFICSSEKWHNLINQVTGPWRVNGPALYIAEQALKDKLWHQTQISKLTQQQQALSQLLTEFGFNRQISCPLFIRVETSQAKHLYHALCRLAVYVRLTDEQDALRFGIPNHEQLAQLKKALVQLSKDKSLGDLA